MNTASAYKQLRNQQLHNWINQHTRFACGSLQMIAGDAGFRRYYRFVDQKQSIIAVDAPPETENTSQYIAVAQSYRKLGLTVPQIYASDLEQGFYLQQDFGNRQFSDELDADNCKQLYPKALANIPLIQRCISTDNGPLPEYDGAFIQRELNLFNDWFLAKYLQLSLTNSETSMLAQVFEQLKTQCLLQPKGGMHRDYHSRNLMLLDDEIGVIDFQDAVVGPITYDAVSLLRDSYQNWPKDQVLMWLRNWHAEFYAQYPWDEFVMWFDFMGMQRQIKIAGIFARLYLRDDKPGFLLDIPHTLNYLIDVASQYSEFKGFAKWVSERILPKVLQNLKSDQYAN